MKIDFYKSALILLLSILVYLLYRISRSMEVNAENNKIGRCKSIGNDLLLDTKTGATYLIGSSEKNSDEIVK